jgi:hypothetical protein
MKKVVLYSRDKSSQKKRRICKKKHREHPAIAHDHLVKLKAKDLILAGNEERVVLELPLWNRRHRFLQKNNVATVSEEAAVKMKNNTAHREREIERNKKKESEIQISSAFLLFPLSNCSKEQHYMLCQLPQTICHDPCKIQPHMSCIPSDGDY